MPAEMHQRPEKLSLVTAGMLVPTEMHLRPEELRLLLLKCWWLLKCTLGLRRCTVARHSLLPQVHIHRYQCISICQAYLHRLQVHFCRYQYLRSCKAHLLRPQVHHLRLFIHFCRNQHFSSQ
jgi:hypothetical protein